MPGIDIELSPSSQYTFDAPGQVQDFELKAEVLLPAGYENEEACITFRRVGEEFEQVYLDRRSGTVAHIKAAPGGWTTAARRNIPPPAADTWLSLRLVVQGSEVFFWLDGAQVLHSRDVQPRAGLVGLRIGNGRALWRNLTVTPLAEDAPKPECEFGLACPIECWRTAPPKSGSETVTEAGFIELSALPRYAEAGVPARFEVSPVFREKARITVRLLDAKGKAGPEYKTTTDGQFSTSLAPTGAPGLQKVQVLVNGKLALEEEFEVIAQTKFSVPESPELEAFFNRMTAQVRGDSSTHTLDGVTVRTNPTWIRDHIHELKGYKFWEKDLTSALEFLCERQTAPGFFYEIFMASDDAHTTFVNPDCVQFYPEDKMALVRLELEADVEYLMVEGCYQAWQATGDDEWLARVLPPLARGLDYCMSDPKRWDPTHGLLKRTFTVDTWDFSWGVSDSNRRIEPPIPMAIMHGDNTGLIQACHQVERLWDYLGDETAAAYWAQKASLLRRNLFQTCWNGSFFTHQVHLDGNPLPAGETPEEQRLSLSNAYALNRDVLEFDEGRKVLAEYQNRRKQHGEALFSEWYSVDPPYQAFPMGGHTMTAGTYINGGLAGFVGGELAKGAFQYGEEAYGWDLLERARKQVEQDGSIYFLYTADGANQGGGPSGWAAAAFISALMEGLAGLEDRGKLWQQARISPRWAITGLTQASITAAYGPSGAWLGYDWTLAEDHLTLVLRGSGVEDADFHVLLPAGKRLRKVLAGGKQVPAIEDVLAESHYADFEVKGEVAATGAPIEIYFD